MDSVTDLPGLVREMKPVAATPEERLEVVELYRALSDLSLDANSGAAACALTLPGGGTAPIPETVLVLLEHVAELLARGDAVTVIPVSHELTTQEAAALLKVSRQYVVRLAERGRIPHVWVGTHRKLRLADVLAFKLEREEDRRRSARRARP